MKKFLSVILAVAMLIPCFSVMAEDVTVNVAKKVTAADETSVYRSLATKEAGSIVAAASIPADFIAEGATAKLFIAKYVGALGNELDSVAVKEITSADNGTTVATSEITVAETDKVKAFIWDGLTINPIAVSAQPADKQQIILYDFETEETSFTGNNSAIVENPVGTGNVLKLQGLYDEEAGKQTAIASGTAAFTNAIKAAGVPAYSASTYEFDMLIPAEWTYKTVTENADGTQTVADRRYNVIYDLYFGSTTIYRLRMTISRDNNRIVFYNQGDGAKVLKDHYEKEQGLYNRWIHVKVDIRPYAPEANDASCDANYSQVYITFDNDTVIEEKVGPYSKTTLSTGLLALDGLANSMIMNGESTTCWAKPIYIDNVKMSGLVTK